MCSAKTPSGASIECPADVLSGTGAAKTAAEGYWDHAAPPPFMAPHVDVESDCHTTAVIASADPMLHDRRSRGSIESSDAALNDSNVAQ